MYLTAIILVQYILASDSALVSGPQTLDPGQIHRAYDKEATEGLKMAMGDLLDERKIKSLIDSNADVNASLDGSSLTCLHHALRKNSFNVVRLLVENGANVNLVEETTGETPLHMAVKYCDDEVAFYLLDKGPDISIKDGAGNSPLHICAQYGSV